MASNGGLAPPDLSSKYLALRPMREQGMTQLVFDTPLGQNTIFICFSCSSISSCETWSRWVQTTTFDLPWNPLATRAGSRFQSLWGSSSNDTIGTIAFELDATRRTSDLELNYERKVTRDDLAKMGNLTRQKPSSISWW